MILKIKAPKVVEMVDLETTAISGTQGILEWNVLQYITYFNSQCILTSRKGSVTASIDSTVGKEVNNKPIGRFFWKKNFNVKWREFEIGCWFL